jgi:hypothetical protein
MWWKLFRTPLLVEVYMKREYYYVGRSSRSYSIGDVSRLTYMYIYLYHTVVCCEICPRSPWRYNTEVVACIHSAMIMDQVRRPRLSPRSESVFHILNRVSVKLFPYGWWWKSWKFVRILKIFHRGLGVNKPHNPLSFCSSSVICRLLC